VAFTAEQPGNVKAEFARRKKMTAVGLLIMSLLLYGVMCSIGGKSILGVGLTGWLVLWVARGERRQRLVPANLALPGVRRVAWSAAVRRCLSKVRSRVQMKALPGTPEFGGLQLRGVGGGEVFASSNLQPPRMFGALQ